MFKMWKQPMTAEQVTLGIRDFFNVVIADKLLYKIERVQYSEQLGADKAPAPIDIYGSAHLLRLFAKINGLLNRSRQVHETGQGRIMYSHTS